LLKQRVHVDRLKPCTSTRGVPTEFISLHESDSFDPVIEKENVEPVYPPVIIENIPRVEVPPQPTTDVEFTDIPDNMDTM
jgi:hypothetical protein